MKSSIKETMDDISVVYSETLSSMIMKNHYHNSFEIIFVLEGKAEFVINSKKYVASPGSLIFISHLESHELKVIQYPYKRYYILIKPYTFNMIASDPRLASILLHRPKSFNHIIPLNESERDIVTTLLFEIKQEFDLKQDFYYTSIYALLELFLIRLYRSHSLSFPLTAVNNSLKTILKIQKYLDEHYLEQINLKEVSAMFYIDMYYLSHLFKKVCGFTFRDYIILQRISKAKDLLVQCDMSILQVCSSSGFCNVNHFIRTFKKVEGITPGQFRKIYMR